jgi:hypothetical protein
VTYLINGWPWGWGSLMVMTMPADWVCEHCGKAPNKRRRNRENFVGCHVYLFGPPRCTACAESWCRLHWPPERIVTRRLKRS